MKSRYKSKDFRACDTTDHEIAFIETVEVFREP